VLVKPLLHGGIQRLHRLFRDAAHVDLHLLNGKRPRSPPAWSQCGRSVGMSSTSRTHLRLKGGSEHEGNPAAPWTDKKHSLQCVRACCSREANISLLTALAHAWMA
jgi:hypothetical protein